MNGSASTDYHLAGRTNGYANIEHADAASIHLASVEEKKRLWWRNAIINTAFIASWFLFSTLLSVYNKWMFSPDHYGFPWPLFVTTVQMFVQFTLAALLRTFFPRHFRPDRDPSRQDYVKRAVPTGIATGLDIGLSNLSLQTITLSFYTMVKSSGLIFVLFFAFAFNLEKFSWRLIGVVMLIFAGVVLMVATQTNFQLVGLILVLTASALGGLRWSLTQLLLKNRKVGMDNPAATLFWLTPIMGVTLGLVSLFWDGWIKVFRSEYFDGIGTAFGSSLFLLAPGIIAFCMVLSEYYILQRAGIVPMSIAGICKEVTTITISAWLFGDELTPLNVTGVVITISGITLYTYHKYRKSIESTVPLDAHGNPIEGEDEGDGIVELGETEHLTSVTAVDGFEEDGDIEPPTNQVIFSAQDDGEEDADELRSIRSSKLR